MEWLIVDCNWIILPTINLKDICPRNNILKEIHTVEASYVFRNWFPPIRTLKIQIYNSISYRIRITGVLI